MPYDKRNPELRQAMARIALALPGVFESPQWGGWVYKVPDPASGKGRAKAKMLCYVVDGKNHGWHCQFKLPGRDDEGRAAEAVKRHAWVEPHPWKTLGPSGWVVARPRTAKQLEQLAGLLAESRALLPDTEPETPDVPELPGAGTHGSPVARRMASVMREAREQGWEHRDPDAAAFDG
ncbi:MAG: hypothetical protein AAFX76_02555 [Planctomycetota bacterium]